MWATFRYPSSWPIGMTICRLGSSDAPGTWIRQVVHRITESKRKKNSNKYISPKNDRFKNLKILFYNNLKVNKPLIHLIILGIVLFKILEFPIRWISFVLAAWREIDKQC